MLTKNMKTTLLIAIASLTIFGCGNSRETMTEQAPPKEQKVVMVPSQHEATPAANSEAPAPSGPKIDDKTKQPGDR
jgi:uncharacterized protein YcfL